MAKGDRSIVTKRPEDKVTLGQVQALIHAAAADEVFVGRLWRTLSQMSQAEDERRRAAAKADSRPWWRVW